MINRKLKITSIVLLILTVFFLVNISSFGQEQLQGELEIYHAGSLTVPVANLIKEFKVSHPNLVINTTPGGSRKIARLVAETGQKADILMSADYTVIDTLLIPEHANWNILFAENSMVIMYTDQSRYSNEINEDNWYKILLKEKVEYGHSEPNADPCGYRSVLVFQLAENYYQQEGLNLALLDHCPKKNIRSKSVELISLLETGVLDYAFEYESVALQHQLKDEKFRYIKLPKAIDLSSLEYIEDYAKATVELSGTEPGETITKKAQPIVYGITMPFNGENRENALAFLKFLFDKNQGLKIIQDSGQPIHNIEVVAGADQLPSELCYLLK
ncbi:MAG: tungstate ABC transporter substrate-binding protein WtpA [Candidatus Caldatribacteriota bacterium]|nr:tungstate ABC transporter substrate-binding protein WtpA [Candidatus Caldatribacteriota bacterium]